MGSTVPCKRVHAFMYGQAFAGNSPLIGKTGILLTCKWRLPAETRVNAVDALRARHWTRLKKAAAKTPAPANTNANPCFALPNIKVTTPAAKTTDPKGMLMQKS